mmetsp:Transcript_9089/g.8971  ORF Transcript_9089/g.8971 Transcript_9089/m.8971 type:complete len:103 (-) Transcript_9089:752-1060(-)|eukprot:CAMPEP_0119037538 /NCGR_PEP_ID=MMETSP1177-20130426/5957_1 /TAXON_ID=2985 /ORGANISM="Ochromonas sp, Strain CCMP1899" /LENGTH=102 /DNA_ID=CAMNT_0006998957 /DNA_START=88 /DNA_END=396 /DNA_ORIENTATION=-
MPKYTHIVVLKFKECTSDETIESIFSTLRALLSEKKIAGLEAFTGGPYASPEGMNKGFTHAFSMIFADETSRDAYFPHPDHESVKQMIIPHVDDFIAFDYAM